MPDPKPWDGLSTEELEKVLDTTNAVTGDVVFPDDPTPVEAPQEAAEAPSEEAATEDVADEPEPVEEASATPEPESEDPRDKKIRELERHAARLAGEIGYLKLKTGGGSGETPAPSPEAQSDEDDAADPSLQYELEALRAAREEDAKRIERLENEYDVKTFERAGEAAIARAEGLLGTLTPDDEAVAAVAASKLAPFLAQVRERHDPERVQAGWDVAADAVASEILQARNAKLKERRASTAREATIAKRSTQPSGSGAVATPIPRPKGVGDMSVSELDAWMRENAR